MSVFGRKRYTFSERLRARERRRQRVKLFCFALLCFVSTAALWPSSDGPSSEQIAQVASAARVSDTEQGSDSAASLARARLEPSSDSKPSLESEPVSLQNNAERQFEQLREEVQKLLPESDRLPSAMLMESGASARLTIEPGLQEHAIKLLKRYAIPYGALVAINPKSGEIMTLAGYSRASQKYDSYRFALRAGMPAASLIKVVSAAAALEKGGVAPEDEIHFRGGTYTLNKWNYKPDERRDTRVISLQKALATSCNPAFGRIGVQVTGADLLARYADSFGFNRQIPFLLPLQESRFSPIEGDYALARTAAGFGDVFISPLHAALMMAAVANDGKMLAPKLLKSFNVGTRTLHADEPETITRIASVATSRELLRMMEHTVISGTGRKQFSRRRAPKLRGIRVAAKTGTLSGKTPKGRYYWLIAAAPIENPEIAIAALVVDPGNAKINGTALGRLFLEEYFSKYAKAAGREV